MTGSARTAICAQALEERSVKINPTAICAVSLGRPVRVREKYAVGNQRESIYERPVASAGAVARRQYRAYGQSGNYQTAPVAYVWHAAKSPCRPAHRKPLPHNGPPHSNGPPSAPGTGRPFPPSISPRTAMTWRYSASTLVVPSLARL